MTDFVMIPPISDDSVHKIKLWSRDCPSDSNYTLECEIGLNLLGIGIDGMSILRDSLSVTAVDIYHEFRNQRGAFAYKDS